MQGKTKEDGKWYVALRFARSLSIHSSTWGTAHTVFFLSQVWLLRGENGGVKT